MKGQIIKILSNTYTVKIGDKIIDCKARGKFRNDKITPVVGDYCAVDINNNYILNILTRKNELKRPAVANIDYLIIITSVKEPDLDLMLLDRLLIQASFNNITPIICFTKTDLLKAGEKKEYRKVQKYYQKIGIKTITNKNKLPFKILFKNKLIALTGQTGSGKSTLINTLNKDLNLKTDKISMALGRGKHTTRHSEIYSVNNFYIIDTPGFSALEFNEMTKEDIMNSFIEFDTLCRYKDCRHIKEDGCKVKEDLENGKILQSRYDNYVKFMGEVKK